MHVHLPKPLHGWRAFVGEVGIIVLGVLIALGAESLLEQARWDRQIDQSKRAFKQELLLASANGYERLAIQPCLQARLRALTAELSRGAGDWHAMPEQFNGAGRYYVAVMPVVYRPPTRSMLDDAWRNALADGAINHLTSNEAQALSNAYGSVQDFRTIQDEENQVETKLSPLGFDGRLDRRARIEMIQAIAELDRLNDLLVTVSRNLHDAVRLAKLGITQAETEKVRTEMVNFQRNYRGTCVAAPPLKLTDE